MSARSIGGALAAIVGRDHASDDPAALAAAAVDGRAPRWIVQPSTVEQVSGVLAVAAEDGLAVIPRGSGSALDLGAPPSRLDVVVDLRGLGDVLEYNPDDLTVSVQAGVTLGDLAGRLDAHRQFLALDPPGSATRTLGGVAATGTSGPLRCRYGTMRDLLLGVRFVQADGVVTWGGARVVKSVTGYDVPKLMVGSLGTLGVLGELTLRLHPLPDVERTWLVTMPSLFAAQAFVTGLLDSPREPSRVEWLNRQALTRVAAPDAPAALAISVGSVEAAVAAQGEAIRALARRERGEVTEIPAGWWTTYVTRFGADRTVLRVATLPSHLAQTIAEIDAGFGEGTAVITGSAATGALDVSSDAGIDDVIRAVERLRAFLAPLGGHAIVTRAPVALRAAIDPWGPVEPGALGLMRGLKDEFDPRRILNPGRFVGGL